MMKSNIAQVQNFQNFLELPLAAKFTSGWFISQSGFSRPTLTYVETECPSNLRLGTYSDGKLIWNYPEIGNDRDRKASQKEESRKLKYIGVFTCKGGVGKTTVAAHLAGAFALMGHDVILIDLDPDKNLRKLFLQDSKALNDKDSDASLFVPGRRGQPGNVITVLDYQDWAEEDYPDIKLVICDCSPVLKENPLNLVEKFDYCIIPTTLNPLGVSKNGDVIVRTFEHIRKQNKKADMFALINNFYTSKDVEKRNEVLLTHLKKNLSKYTSTDSKCKFIDPEAAKIRYSKSLLYWGYHIVEGTKPQLAFCEIAGRSHPRVDFLQLAEYLEEHTTIDRLREEEKKT